ncbi:glycoside hydrolase family 3 N-terminal domain-containing protein [Mycetocola zhadangensis]|uniref:glycoside hydrolase family 3 N-terminal domain-containing protein n=1 Tax=Mycetocola zhadangensis TaxID=1164595 RepID=UPI003A4DBA3D
MSTNDERGRAARVRLSAMTLEQKIASLLMLHVPGTDPGRIHDFTAEHQPGGLILMPDNIPPSTEALASLTAAAHTDAEFPVLVAIDQEGGFVRRIVSDDHPSSVTLKHRPASETHSAFSSRAAMLAAAGVTVNFGIVGDVTNDPTSFIYDRALGVTYAESAERVSAAIAGERGAVRSTVKHFPGHGRTPGDSHTSIPETDSDADTWWRTDAVPFAAAITAGVDLVMVGHLRYTAVDDTPATLSTAWNRILRTRLGFHGVIITDDMFMVRDSGLPEYQDASENAIRALVAGNTMLLYVLRGDRTVDGTDTGTLIAGIAAAVHDGRIPIDVIDDAALRILRLRASIGRATP